MPRHPNADRIQTGGRDQWNSGRTLQHKSQRPRKKSFDEPPGVLTDHRGKFVDLFEIRYMGDQRIVCRPHLGRKDLLHRVCIKNVRSQTVNCLGRKRAYAAISNELGRFGR